jgi:hypothetical protein
MVTNEVNVLGSARKYTRWGWRVVPIPAGEKAPRLKGWQTLRLKLSALRHHFKGGENIGVLLGKPSKGLVDIDLDCREAVSLGPMFLPYTGRMHGRKSNPNSHWWYKVTPIPAPSKFCDPDGTSLVELRSTGQQTVVPPSIHPSGERIKWERKQRCARVDKDELYAAVAKLAAAALLARHWPARGSRNETALALAGTLLRARWDDLEVGDFVAAVAKAANDEEWTARKAVALTTQKRLDEKRDATGRPRLASLLGDEVVKLACNWLGLVPEEYLSVGVSPAPVGWPRPLSDRAMQGLAGDIVNAFNPHTEAHPAALLIQTLVGFGNLVGPGPFFRIESTRHPTNLFAILVGETSKARKGTAWGRVMSLLELVDPLWTSKCHASGLSSGEGIVSAVQDHAKPKPGLTRKPNKGGAGATPEPAASDKRLMVYESEFARALRVQRREGNILSTLLRQAWDSGNLQILTKESARATGAHISLVGHITKDELHRELTVTDEANGFANRFLFVCVTRSKLLPLGGRVHGQVLFDLGRRLRKAANFARGLREVTFSGKAKILWCKRYPTLSAAVPGLLGAITARAEAQVLRLSLIYALLDLSPLIKLPHLRAALEVWRYCKDSCRYIFGRALGDPVADRILEALRKNPQGLTRTEISAIFGRNVYEATISAAIEFLRKHGRAFEKPKKSGKRGRPTERWFLKRKGRVGR